MPCKIHSFYFKTIAPKLLYILKSLIMHFLFLHINLFGNDFFVQTSFGKKLMSTERIVSNFFTWSLNYWYKDIDIKICLYIFEKSYQRLSCNLPFVVFEMRSTKVIIINTLFDFILELLLIRCTYHTRQL